MFALLLSVLLSVDPAILTGRVVSVADGDTLTMLVNRQQHKIRLNGIDAPEKGQAFGTKSKDLLSKLTFQKTVTVRLKEKDKYGRWIADVTAEGVDVNRAIVEAGLAWHYKKYSDDSTLDAIEKSARAARIGLWADASPIPPWEYRHSEEARRKSEKPIAKAPPPKPPRKEYTRPRESEPPPEPDPPAEKEEVTVYITKTGQKYHAAGCRHLKSSIPISLEKARAGGYSPCKVCGGGD